MVVKACPSDEEDKLTLEVRSCWRLRVNFAVLGTVRPLRFNHRTLDSRLPSQSWMAEQLCGITLLCRRWVPCGQSFSTDFAIAKYDCPSVDRVECRDKRTVLS